MFERILIGTARYGRVLLLVNAACVTMPAAATTVAEVLEAQAALLVPAGMTEEGWRAYRAGHEAELRRAYDVVALARAVEEAVLATHEAGFAQYGTPLLCNVDEERLPAFPALVDRFVADGAVRHGLTEREARPRLLQADVTEMLPVALLSWYRCPR